MFGEKTKRTRRRERQGPQENGIHHREDGCIRADSQSQSQDGHRREASVLQQSSRGIDQIGKHPSIVEQTALLRLAVGLKNVVGEILADFAAIGAGLTRRAAETLYRL
jgi:hypothetical protein